MDRMTEKTFLAQPAPLAAPVGVREIVELQRRLVEEGNSLSLVNEKIQETAKEIERLKGAEPAAPNFDAPRELLLAEIALDKADAAALKKLDQESTAALKVYAAAVKDLREKIAPLESTGAGLRRKAQIYSRTIEALRAEHKALCLEYLMGQAEEAGKEYAEACTRAVKAMDNIITLASLHVRAGGSNMIGKSGIDTIDFPPLGLASTRGTALPPLDPAARTAAFDAAEEQILASLKAEGLAIPFPETAPAKPAKAHAPGIGEGTPVYIVRPEENRFPDGHVRPAQAVTE